MANTSRQLGGALGLVALATISATATKGRLACGDTVAAALTNGYGHALLIAGFVSVAGALSALFLGDSVQLPPANTNA
jgi:hypothetical protein